MCASITAAVHTYSSRVSVTAPVTANNTTSIMGSSSQLSGWQRVLLIWHTISLHCKRNTQTCRHSSIQGFCWKHNKKKLCVDAHRDICKGRPHHEVEDPRLQLEDVGWGEDHPGCGQDKKQEGRQEGQEGFVQAAVLQSVAAVSSANTHTHIGPRVQSTAWNFWQDGVIMCCCLTSGHWRGSWVRSPWRSRLRMKRDVLVSGAVSQLQRANIWNASNRSSPMIMNVKRSLYRKWKSSGWYHVSTPTTAVTR